MYKCRKLYVFTQICVLIEIYKYCNLHKYQCVCCLLHRNISKAGISQRKKMCSNFTHIYQPHSVSHKTVCYTGLCVWMLHRNTCKNRILHRNICVYVNTIKIDIWKLGLFNSNFMIQVVFLKVAVRQFVSRFNWYCLLIVDWTK